MKRLLPLLIISLIVLISCDDYKRQKKQKQIDETIEKELATGIRNDTIFLGLEFGMSKNKVNNEMNKLIKEGKIYLDNDNNYRYKFDFGDNTLPHHAIAGFSTFYHKNKLYKFIVVINETEPESMLEVCKLTLFMTYLNKYKNCFRQKSILDDSHILVCINGNRKIKILSGLTDVRIIYTDLIAEKEIDTQLEKQNIQKKDKIKSDI